MITKTFKVTEQEADDIDRHSQLLKKDFSDVMRTSEKYHHLQLNMAIDPDVLLMLFRYKKEFKKFLQELIQKEAVG